MNKQEKIIAGVLFVLLAAWVVLDVKHNRDKQRSAAVENAQTVEAVAQPVQPASVPAVESKPVIIAPAAEQVPERIVELQNPEIAIKISSRGGVIKSAVLNEYQDLPGDNGNPVLLDFNAQPALGLEGVSAFPPETPFAVDKESETSVTLTAVNPQGLMFRRHIELQDGYQIAVTDSFQNNTAAAVQMGPAALTLGSMHRGASKNDILGVDALPGGEGKTVYWESKIQGLFTGGSGGMFGCSGNAPAANLPEKAGQKIDAEQSWVAIKSRFFVQLFAASDPVKGYAFEAVRSKTAQTYQLDYASAKVFFADEQVAANSVNERAYRLYLGPKKLSLLRSLDMRAEEVMDFGFFKWFCIAMVPTLNFFHSLIPNYGIAIILLTLLVRIIFWPLTHRSTESMKRMQEIQPLLKAVQAEFKDNPQKIQQETWKIYRENKVNPLASCLPMLVQIPVFIALFTVLRSSVELRYAPFLWIVDLSEPENLLAGILPIPLNIWPLLMTVTMALQSYLTPSMGDPAQQKMMMIMMPLMMLFMFYSMPSALCLYWTVSQVLSIVQMLMQRRKAKKPGGPSDPEVLLTTRQQRRAAERTV